jgi:hypothetical protein
MMLLERLSVGSEGVSQTRGDLRGERSQGYQAK